MALTVAQGFRDLRANLEITGLQEETVSTRQRSVRSAIDKGLTVSDDFLTGSYRRSTLVPPLSEADIDIFVVLDSRYFASDNPGGVLNTTKDVLKKTYPLTPSISANGQAVTIRFTDFRVDVVPAFNRKGGGYLIPDLERATWIATDPKQHLTIWSAENKWHNGNLIPMIKILKAWNKKRDLVRSFHLEVLALTVFQNVTISDFASGARYFFDNARNHIRVKLKDPAGYSDDVARYITTIEEAERIVKGLDLAYSHAIRAEEFERKGATAAAIAQWQKLFPDYFPAFG